MRAHPSSPELLELGLRAVSNMAQESPSSRRTLIHMNAAPLVTGAMYRYRELPVSGSEVAMLGSVPLP